MKRNLIVIYGHGYMNNDEWRAKVFPVSMRLLHETFPIFPHYYDEVRELYDSDPANFKARYLEYIGTPDKSFNCSFCSGYVEQEFIENIYLNLDKTAQANYDYSRRRETASARIEYWKSHDCIELSDSQDARSVCKVITDLAGEFNGAEVLKDDSIIDERYLCSIGLGIHDFYWE